MQLRKYQKEAIDLARKSFAKGNKRICLTLCTGAGKSIIARKIVESFKEKNPNGKVIYLTFRTVLINQMIETFQGLDIEIGTLQKYGKEETKQYDLVIIDEVHYAFKSKLQNNINTKFLLGLSATPIDSYGNALEFDDIVDVVQLCDLIQMGYASPVKVLSNSNIDTSNLKTTAGDFNQKQSYDLMSKSKVQKNIVDTYLKYAKGLKTIVYGVNIKHCEHLKEEFLKAGINCDSVHSKKSDTLESIEKFRNNEIEVLINADILVTGFDAPDVYCLILAAPTKSVIKAVQIFGRATRLNPSDPNKEALIIDCAEVIKNTIHPLEKMDFKKKKEDKNIKKCSKCEEVTKLINRKIEPINDFEYSVISSYKCNSCNNYDEVINIKLINQSSCEECGEPFISNGMIMNTQEDKSIIFDLECNSCGYKRKFREILYTNEELKHIEYNEAFKSNKWEDVEVIIKAEVKKAGYHWKYAPRLLTHLQMNFTPVESIEKIKMVLAKGQKISRLMYV